MLALGEFDSLPAHLEEIKVERLDFSQFHALDHMPGSPYCWTQYGGLRIHLAYGWDLKWRPWLRCKVGLHNWTEWQRGDGSSAGRGCWGCMKGLEDG